MPSSSLHPRTLSQVVFSRYVRVCVCRGQRALVCVRTVLISNLNFTSNELKQLSVMQRNVSNFQGTANLVSKKTLTSFHFNLTSTAAVKSFSPSWHAPLPFKSNILKNKN